MQEYFETTVIVEHSRLKKKTLDHKEIYDSRRWKRNVNTENVEEDRYAALPVNWHFPNFHMILKWTIGFFLNLTYKYILK